MFSGLHVLLLAHTRFSLAGYKYPGIKMLRACMVRYLKLINYHYTDGQLFKFLENKAEEGAQSQWNGSMAGKEDF